MSLSPQFYTKEEIRENLARFRRHQFYCRIGQTVAVLAGLLLAWWAVTR